MNKNHFRRSNYHFNKWYNKDLWNKYNNIKYYPLTIIRGGMGNGKSSSLSKFVESNFNGKFTWLSLNENFKLDLNIFWKLIVEAFIFYNNDLREEMNKIIRNLEQKELDIKTVLNDLVEILFDNLNNDSILVIDNLEFLANNYIIANSLSYFINLIPNSFHLVIITRSEIYLPKLERWGIQSRVQFIGEDEFMLNKEEIKSLLTLEYNLNLSEDELKMIYQKTEGWILAIDFIAKEYNKENLEDFLNNYDNFEMIDAYFNYQVLAKIDDELLIEFLMKTSLLIELDIKIANRFLKIDNSDKLIKLIRDNFGLVERVGERRYRFYNLFKEFLRNKFKQIYIDFDHSRLIDIYLELDMVEEATCYSCQNNCKAKLIDIILQNGNSLIGKERYNFIEKALCCLTEDDFENNPLLYLYQGDYHLYRHDLYKSLTSYQQGEKIFRDRGERSNLKKSLFKSARLYAFFNSNLLLKYLEKLLALQANLSVVEEEELIYLRFISNLIKGDNLEAKSLLPRLEDSGYYNELLANLLFMEGDFDKSLKIINSIDKPREDYVFYNTLIVPILINLLVGNFDNAQEYILRKLDQGSFVIELFADYYLAQIAEFCYIEPRVELKELYLQKLNIIADCPYHSSWYRLELILNIVFWEVFYGDLEKVLYYGKVGLEYAQKRDDKLFMGLLNKAIGIKYYFDDSLERAVELLEQAVDYFLSIENNLLLASAYLWIALVFYKSGEDTKLEDCISKLLSIIREKNYNFLLSTPNLLGSRDPNHFIPLLLKARTLGIERDYLNQLLKGLSLEDIDYAPGYSLKVKALGRLKVYRGSQLIAEDEWGRKKSKELFKLLLVNYGQLINKDYICRILYPDYNQENAYRNFSVNLTYLNKVLEPQRKNGQKPYFIIREGDYYGLTRMFAYIYDVEIFENLIDRAKQANYKPLRVKYYQQALELYDDFIIDDLYNEEIIKERKRLQQLYLEIVDEIMEYYYQNGDYNKCIQLADRSLKMDKYFELAYLYKIKSYKQLNLRTYAIKTYKKCKDILEEELNISPSQEIEDYYESIIN